MTEHDNSRPLDVHRWSDHPEVNSFVYKLWDEEFVQYFPQRKKGSKPLTNPKYQFKVLILDLYVAWKQDPTLKLGVGLSKRAYNASSRYNALHISAAMIDLVHALHEREYIQLEKGSEAAGKVTRISPTQKLVKLFMQARFSEYDVGQTDEIEVIVLNLKDDGSGAKPIEYQDTDYPAISQMRLELQDYNALLRNTFIDIGSLENPAIEKQYWDAKGKTYRLRRIQIRQNNKLVRRIFYRGSWKLGGRFHGGWWQQISSEDRQNILLDDRRTIEVDYSGLHVSLIYCLAGQPPPDDPYELPWQLEGYDKLEQRKVVKGLVLCAINAKSRSAAFQAYRNGQSTGSKQKSLKDSVLTKLLDSFIDHNPPVKNYTGLDKGVELMKLDGDITAYIISHFTKQGIPILTVHDSYIVPEGKDGELIRTMNHAVQYVLGNYKIRLKQEVVSLDMLQAFANQDSMDRQFYKKQMTNMPKPERCEGYIERRAMFNQWKKKNKE